MPGAVIAQVCRRNDIVSSLVHKWRKQERDKAASGLLPPFIGYGGLAALPQQCGFPGGNLDLLEPCERQIPLDYAVAATGVIEIAFPGGVQVCIRGDVSDRALERVFDCLRHGPC
jgi:hypothetical protein